MAMLLCPVYGKLAYSSISLRLQCISKYTFAQLKEEKKIVEQLEFQNMMPHRRTDSINPKYSRCNSFMKTVCLSVKRKQNIT